MNAQIEQEASAKRDEQEARKEKSSKVDFKMATFSLAGKDYGIDIMSVKEIAKAGKFTYVPNAAPFVRGVYNLRGDIISVIDLRIMFHLPAQRKAEDSLESLLILRMEDHVFGVIVDSIDKVVGISQESIQPPHPIFSDVNIKYIRGVVENASRLYILLDIERIFVVKDQKEERAAREEIDEDDEPIAVAVPVAAVAQADEDMSELDLSFIKDTLFTFSHFAVTELNKAWVESRFEEWKRARKSDDFQLKDLSEAEEFLATFHSPHTNEFWGEAYAKAVAESLPDIDAKTINVWNPGCGKGYETYSLCCVLKSRFPEARIKIWANDSDLLNISTAPNLVFDAESAPAYVVEHAVKGRNGYSFDQSVRDAILFEYHDILNSTPLPDIDLILCRDLLSFLAANDQRRVMADFQEKAKVRSFFIAGENEELAPQDGWKQVSGAAVRIYARSAE
jgi:purine-binding chemotaxis protein CheW